MASLFRVVEREAFVYRRMWRGSAVSTLVTPVLFLAGIGVGLGGLVDERSGAVEGLPYLDFVVPGLLAGSAMQLGVFSSLWPVMIGTTWSRTYHGMTSSPISAASVYGGHVVWITVRALMAATVFLALSALFGGVPSWWGLLAVVFAGLTAAAFAAPVTAFTGKQDSDQAFPVVVRLGVMPLFLFSGTFFPVSQLPGWLEGAAWLSPLWHGVELCRAATTGSWGRLGPGRVVVHVAALLLVAAAGAWWGTRTFDRKLAG